MRVETSNHFPAAASAADLRRMAMQCAAQADMPDADETERDKLLKMREALLSLAANEDWLNGRSAGCEAVVGEAEMVPAHTDEIE
jgi:RecB family exonuclease